MSGWIYLAVIVISLLPLRNAIVTGLHNDSIGHVDDEVDTFTTIMGSVLALVLAGLWPLTLLVGLVAFLPKYFAPSAAEKRAALAAREDLLDQRERDIAALEDKLGIERTVNP